MGTAKTFCRLEDFFFINQFASSFGGGNGVEISQYELFYTVQLMGNVNQIMASICWEFVEIDLTTLLKMQQAPVKERRWSV